MCNHQKTNQFTNQCGRDPNNMPTRVPLKTFQYQIGESGCDLDPANWKEIQAYTMRDAIIPALQCEAKTREIPMPSVVYLVDSKSPRHSNGAPFRVHAFEVTQ